MAAAGTATWRWLDREPAPAVPAAPTPTTPVVAPDAPVPVEAEVKPATPPPKPVAAPAGTVKFPDGSSMPALNGVQTEVVIAWGTKPFTRVVGTEDGPNGWKWYVHENGTRSTTVMLETNGVPGPTGLVAEPTTVLPTREEIPEGQGTGAPGNPPRTGGQK